MTEEKFCCLPFEKVEKTKNRKIMLGFVEIAEGEMEGGRVYKVFQSENRNVITIECDGFYNHVILKEIVARVLSESEEIENRPERPIDMIKNLVDHALVSSGEGSQSLPKQFSKESKIEKTPTEYSLSANYPNPFNPSTTISFELPEASNVNLVVYDYLGREVTTLVNDYRAIGHFDVTFNANNLASGVYFYKLKAGNFTSVKKMMLVK